ncbi:MAG: NAD-dependent epimerase/dehydratase family protein [Chloroflexota bacterium]|nr:MAG: NAD-dependent epimerase/dehydratase family protein [Chloroflexota bacterium]
MKILVTGGAGFIGSHTVDLLLANGYQVRILDSLTPPVHQDGLLPSYVPPDAEFMRGDMRNRDDVDRALQGVDAVIHLAAYQDYLTDFSKFFHVNTVGTALIFELIVEKQYPVQKVVFASSQATYGEAKYLCPEHGAQYPELRSEEQLLARDWEPCCPVCGGSIASVRTDEAVVKPHNQYAMSKYTQEMIALNLGKRYGIPTVGLRYSITQGPRQSFSNAYSGICRIFTLRLMNDRAPIAYEDGQQLRDYVYVGDVARANLLALEDQRANYQVFNVGGREVVSVLEYAYLVADVLGKRIDPVVPGEFRFGDTRHVMSDITKLQSLGWEPTTSLREIVTDYAAWAEAQPNVRDYYAEAEVVMKQRGTVRMAPGAKLSTVG